MKNCVIVSAVRTAIGSFNGALATTSATDLGAIVIKAALERARLDPRHVDEVIMGNVLQAGLGQNPARQALLKSGLAETVCGFTVNKVCGSGLKSVALAAQAIQAGQAQALVAGGMENMSQAPYLIDAKARWGYRLGDGQLSDVILRDGLICATHGYHMGITAENVAREYGISRDMQDELALHSQRKAIAAINSGAFQAEIVPVSVRSRKKTVIFERDEFPKADSTAEGLAALRPAFDKAGTVTAGNASGINDGAAALVVMEESVALTAGLKPLARIKAYASGGVAPALMGMGPVPATQKALQLSGLQLSDIDLIEANEAFAAQFLAVGKRLGFDLEKVNVNGGAIALGHPIGASGARILVTLLHSLSAHDKTLGLATLCIGGGQGVSMIVERLN
ncbi:acetyl-CoA C-acetyltransferase [Salmonella enterica]|uniref:Acetyl-CoA C-acetyltransferase n=2 Tax=Salmonella enterica TaxID=28901 RepID=A0A603XEF5_SALER|nr:acetyl-CoA C-acetyltransferase [Salmonella enterica subsp. enterica serovar Java]EAN9726080.1 acetyl-CoA C-acetyltransferase [Salmonella enterica]EBV8394777.1 acetyl-CoA C-acetyltransferase [Salmonella enterica subsp. enterica serovar Virchow]EDQ0183295.1 acetyl-CoA C-acetyltransferase [Salmonella enterica subsp. enterica serovar 4,[5],12:b:-]EDV9613997.1 acetyl-CoA C-acetyltransferase [Salmonella enterica subsp. enterica serovar Paratyphi B]EEE5613226.1 acetyl-CoA C-acyltransferase [Salmon